MPGGIHPPEHKTISNKTPSDWLRPSDEIILPFQYSSNMQEQLLVKQGDKISAGQVIFRSSIDQFADNMHSPYDAEVLEISDKNIGHESGLLMPCILLKVLSANKQTSMLSNYNWLDTSADILIKCVHDAGIVGMGGAAFPTHIKLNSGQGRIETLIVNAMECEPYITCDDVLLREHSQEILQGALIAAKVAGATKILFGIEDNKPEATKILAEQILQYLKRTDKNSNLLTDIQIIVAKTKYPSGGEKQLIQLLTGLQVPQNKYPAALGIIVQNVATLFAIYDAICRGRALTHRLVTLTGNLVNKPGNYWIAFGTPLSHIVAELAVEPNNMSQVIFGGPLMGKSFENSQRNGLADHIIPTQKSTNCIIFNQSKEKGSTVSFQSILPSQSTIGSQDFHDACIRCGECESACPVSLIPQQLYWFAQSEQWDQLEQHNLQDCIECGACSYVCPSKIPLVNYYRFAKSEIKHLKTKQKKSELAKQRFENRENRLVRIKSEREAKRRKTAEARKVAADAKKNDPDGKKSAIEAALQRVKNKKEEKS